MKSEPKSSITSALTNESSDHSTHKSRTKSEKSTKKDHKIKKAVDSWIDELDPNVLDRPPESDSSNLIMLLLVQQRLPRVIIKIFDGSADQWIGFIVQFFENVHKQYYLTDIQKLTYLRQHLKGEPKKAINGFPNNKEGYLNSLKRLKYMFGKKVIIAQTILSKVTKGKPIAWNDVDGLSNYYYQISDCLHTLDMMCYYSNLYSTDVYKASVKTFTTVSS